MIRKVVRIDRLGDPQAARRDLEYWLTRPPEERVAAVEMLRRQVYGDHPPRLQRVARVLRQRTSEAP